MSNPHVTLIPIPDTARAEGTLQGHPEANIRVRTNRIGPDILAISLHLFGDKVGEGVLRRVDGEWRGDCTEYNARWIVRGRVGTGILELVDPAGEP